MPVIGPGFDDPEYDNYDPAWRGRTRRSGDGCWGNSPRRGSSCPADIERVTSPGEVRDQVLGGTIAELAGLG
ncbi:hypothetical protein [Streptomyces sp. NPDC058304]|uniref:hypothetical protein n=1 Tax=Streptomyces sp. NPDC058304 TaxID=3346437 RepID=UPI0036E3BB12